MPSARPSLAIEFDIVLCAQVTKSVRSSTFPSPPYPGHRIRPHWKSIAICIYIPGSESVRVCACALSPSGTGPKKYATRKKFQFALQTLHNIIFKVISNLYYKVYYYTYILHWVRSIFSSTHFMFICTISLSVQSDMCGRASESNVSALFCSRAATFYGTPEHTRVYKCVHIFMAFRWLICQQFPTYIICPARTRHIQVCVSIWLGVILP